MKIGTAFPSKYLRAADIPDGQFVPVVIESITQENVAGSDDADDVKPVIHFVGKTKGMVLNKTNATTIANSYGDETDDWAGKGILLYATETLFQGQSTPCLRVKIPKQQAAQTPQNGPAVGRERITNRPPVANPIGNEQVFEKDDIPF